ncbi:nicotinate phosphoribosyltransferase [Skermanella stibiiresistens SB22]|uniref:Nicotinate phosphoribosyltransferase n=1 Tax=Skermanella stibiiresistens SB22 TaxID=1385369 RepID=W9H6X1_9PROT|nr:nicotinate phosphoribosyltransferase [Skermanella stibiiresistens]EWY41985.1 nicotinate phosphoribosyltransferase [Skermanella stibiiresistens SB22]
MDSRDNDATPADLNPSVSDIARWTDTYFLRTKATVGRFGDKRVTYAIFMRRPVVSAPRQAVDWLNGVARERGFEVEIDLLHTEGRWVGAGEPILYITGPLYHLVDLETLLLMKLGPACVGAYNAFTMCADLPKVAFLAMDARHCAGTEMAEIMAYAASVGSARAKRKVGAIGFIGNATDATAHYFGRTAGLGTMPHALIGYAGSTVRAAEMFHETFPDQDLTVLVDYFGREVTDALEVCRRLPHLAAAGRLSMRIDTPGGRFIEGLDPPGSYAVLERHVPSAIRGYRDETQLRYLIGTGVSAAAIFHLRDALDAAGFDKVKIVASSGFSPAKCRIMAEAQAPIDVIGTGSYLPERWTETYATADIIEYDGEKRVKVGREFLFRK